MPQLDLGIFFFEFIFNFFFFWGLYIVNSKYIFILINKNLKFKNFKLKNFDLLSVKLKFKLGVFFFGGTISIVKKFSFDLFNNFIFKIKNLMINLLKNFYVKFNFIAVQKNVLSYLNVGFFLTLFF